MADGGWPQDSEPGERRTHLAVEQLRGVLSELEARLAGPGSTPLRPEAAQALVRALEALAIRIVRFERETEDRHGELTALLRAQAEREARSAERLELALAELAHARVHPRPPPADPSPIRAVLVVAGALAALSVTGAGVVAVSYPQVLPRLVAGPFGALADLPLRPGLRLARPAAPARTLTAPLPTTVGPPPPAAAGDSYEAVTTALARGEATALPRLTGLAQGGDPRAQLDLAGFYETGGAGLPRDIAAARLWTRRAAEGGERVAMHNLALFLANGEGGPRDVVEAAAWFRRAADRGVVDSQYNLGLLYEAGRGVEKNLREAYRWFAIAANAGDTAAREKQVELEGQLKGAERAGLDQAATSFQPGQPRAAETALVIAPAATVAETQALLARQGYYIGPADGVGGPAYRAAASAYLRDHPGARTP